MFKETKTRSVTKTVLWRMIAILNSYLILVLVISDEPIYNALLMNLTGFIVYYFYERFWDRIKKGRYEA
tara:strand:- start:28262 stop:28468 length:207 start_codon:yes stop_codon:yes gene_type:complete